MRIITGTHISHHTPTPEPTKPLVLIVDDEPPMRELERRILNREYAVALATSAEDALAQLGAGLTPDLIIADLEMPDIPGEDMILAVHRLRPHRKVLYVTANIDRLLDKRSFAWPGEAFLDKPFTPRGLREAVSLLLQDRITNVAEKSA